MIGGLLFGWAMAGLFGLFEERAREPVIRPALLGLATIFGLFAVSGIHAMASFEGDIARYAPREKVVTISMANWLGNRWRIVSTARIDLKGEYEEPVVLQSVASATDIATALQAVGWSQAPTMGWRKATQFFEGKKPLDSLIPLPLLHNGTPAVLTMIAPAASPDRRDVLRLWRAGIRIEDIPGRPLVLVGSVTQERVVHPFSGINVLRDQPALHGAVERLFVALEAAPSLCSLSTPDNAGLRLIAPKDTGRCPARH